MLPIKAAGMILLALGAAAPCLLQTLQQLDEQPGRPGAQEEGPEGPVGVLAPGAPLYELEALGDGRLVIPRVPAISAWVKPRALSFMILPSGGCIHVI